MLYKVVLSFQSVDEILMCDHSNAYMKATERYFPVVLFIVHMLQSPQKSLRCLTFRYSSLPSCLAPIVKRI